MNRKTHLLLVVVAVLLALNLAVTVVDWLVRAPEAQANIVAGKNWFTTTSPDGEVVYLWQYWTDSAVGPGATGQIKYYGKIVAGGSFQSN